MNAVNYSTARKNLASIIESVCDDCAPVIITKSGNCSVVMISLADYEAMNETDYLLRNPANAEHLRKSIASSRRGKLKSMSMKEFEEKCNAESAVDA